MDISVVENLADISEDDECITFYSLRTILTTMKYIYIIMLRQCCTHRIRPLEDYEISQIIMAEQASGESDRKLVIFLREHTNATIDQTYPFKELKIYYNFKDYQHVGK